MSTGKTVEAVGRSFPEGLLVAAAKSLEPNPETLQIIGNMVLRTIGRVLGEPPELSANLQILIGDQPSNDPLHIEFGMNPLAGQVTINLPDSGRGAVQGTNASLIQTAAAGALSIEMERRAIIPLTDDDLQKIGATGVRVCGQILQELYEQIRPKLTGDIKLNLLETPPEITAYDFVSAFGLLSDQPK